jgi:hypothetical protein
LRHCTLEELALGRGLALKDLSGLFVPDDEEEQMTWEPHSLKYLDLSDMWGGELDLHSCIAAPALYSRPSRTPSK